MAENSQAVAIRNETGKFVETIQGDAYQQKFRDMLPGDVDLKKFTAVVVRAVQENPALLAPATDKATLFLSCQRAAQDGLLPDGREGALVMYGNKVQWQPMIGGLRKRLADAGYSLRAEVVHANDTFDYDLGDNPGITHKAPTLGMDRGDIIGAYAIATHIETGEKYREVMSIEDLNAVASISRAGNSGPWKGPFKKEMMRKTVGRRLIKSLPIDDRRLNDIIERDNEQYDLGKAKPEPSATATAVQAAVRGQTQPEPIDGTFTDVTGTQDPNEAAEGAEEDPFAG